MFPQIYSEIIYELNEYISHRLVLKLEILIKFNIILISHSIQELGNIKNFAGIQYFVAM